MRPETTAAPCAEHGKHAPHGPNCTVPLRAPHRPVVTPHVHRRPARPAVGSGVAARGRGSRHGDIVLTVAAVGLGASIALGVLSVKSGLHLPGGVRLMVPAGCDRALLRDVITCCGEAAKERVSC